MLNIPESIQSPTRAPYATGSLTPLKGNIYLRKQVRRKMLLGRSLWVHLCCCGLNIWLSNHPGWLCEPSNPGAEWMIPCISVGLLISINKSLFLLKGWLHQRTNHAGSLKPVNTFFFPFVLSGHEKILKSIGNIFVSSIMSWNATGQKPAFCWSYIPQPSSQLVCFHFDYSNTRL